jgi:hypothetical protein
MPATPPPTTVTVLSELCSKPVNEKLLLDEGYELKSVRYRLEKK